MDGQTFETIEEYGRDRWLGELTEELRKKGYRPEAIRRVWIEKPNGGQRPLGIATIRDRVVPCCPWRRRSPLRGETD